MNPGELKHRITFQKLEPSTDDDGFPVQKWVNVIDRWASVSNLSGREYFAAQAVHAENTVKFTIRYMEDVNTNMRIIFNKKYYNITFIDDIKYSNTYIQIKALLEVV